MKLHEHQSKELFAAFGIPVPRGGVATTAEEARRIAEELAVPVVLKAQVLTGGRGKAGGVRLAQSPDEAEALAAEVLGMTVEDLSVRCVLVEEAVEIGRELYLGIVVDRTARRMAVLASAEGGVEIEEIAAENPGAIERILVHPFLGLQGYQTRALGRGIGLEAGECAELDRITRALYEAVVGSDAWLAEINPLAVTAAGSLVALDAKIVLDENGLFRHPELAGMRDTAGDSPVERDARAAGLNYVRLSGDVGCLVNGAGLAMATMDVIRHAGGAPANFLDVVGGAREEQVAKGLQLILGDERVKAVLVNVFGGITRCDEVAGGIVRVLRAAKPKVPLVVRLVGTNDEAGRKMLDGKQVARYVSTATTLAEAAERAVAAAEGGG